MELLMKIDVVCSHKCAKPPILNMERKKQFKPFGLECITGCQMMLVLTFLVFSTCFFSISRTTSHQKLQTKHNKSRRERLRHHLNV